jgi:hypothetical protein
MSKKVRYAIGAAGIVPALGLLTPPAAGALAPVHASKKTVRTAPFGSAQASSSNSPDFTCIASKGYTVSASSMKLRFWSRPAGSRTCIGTIEVTYAGPNAHRTGASVSNAFGQFCVQTAAGTHITDTCRRVFRRRDLRVLGIEIHPNGIPFAQISDVYPFITDPFRTG